MTPFRTNKTNTMSTPDTINQSPGINIDPETITVDSVQEIRAALYNAFLDSCNLLAQVHNSIISPKEAASGLREILAPLQVSDHCNDEEESADDDYDDPCEGHERWTEKQMLEADYRMDELKDRQFETAEVES